jgi:hypothetical protein
MDTQQNDVKLWKIAKRRAVFKWSFAVYLLINIFLSAIWLITTQGNGYFWPAWSLLGWGVGIAYQYINAYHEGGSFTATKEYEKLKNQNQL